MWSLKWGPHVKAFKAQAKKTGVVPPPLKSMPTLLPSDFPLYSAFQSLNVSRPQGAMGSAAIPISEVLAYCQLMGIANLGERAKYLRLIQELDQICLAHWAESSPHDR